LFRPQNIVDLKALSLSGALAALFCCAPSAHGQGSDTTSGVILKSGVSNIEEYNRRIILKEIELEHFSINFRKNNNVQGRWRGWRYFLSQEASAACTASGLTVQLRDRLRVLKHPDIPSFTKDGQPTFVSSVNNRGALETGQILQMVGQSIGAVGSGIELGINIHHQRQAIKKGFGSKASIKHVLALRSEIESLFEERRQAIAAANLSVEELAIASAEEHVLHDLTDLSLQEYANYHLQARRFRAFQDSQYIFDILKSSTGAVGSLLNLLATHNRDPRGPGGAGVVTTTSGALYMLGPLLSRGISKVVASSHDRALWPVTAGISKPTVDDLEKHKMLLGKLEDARLSGDPKNGSAKSLALLTAYDEEAGQRRKQFALATREIRSGTRSATQNIGSGLIVGGSKIAFGVTNIIAGWEFSKFPHRANAVLIPGIIAYGSGSYFAVGDNIRLRLLDEISRKRLAERGELPSRILAEKLKVLDQMETNLKTCSGQ